MYKAIVKYNGNHYSAGDTVRGSKIRTNDKGGIELFDDEPLNEFPFYGEGREEWVEVEPDSIVQNIKEGDSVSYTDIFLGKVEVKQGVATSVGCRLAVEAV